MIPIEMILSVYIAVGWSVAGWALWKLVRQKKRVPLGGLIVVVMFWPIILLMAAAERSKRY